MGKRIILAILGCVFCVGTAAAADLQIARANSHSIILLQGPIDLPDVENLSQILAREPGIREIWLDSR
ncbi:MAG: hypothetical protein MI741_24905, partial [Rhodospirillales bacterium]|nr:hypothetical protein [Rhodospirillales bacterium]